MGLIANIEQIPGESMAVKLCKADKIIFGKDAVPHEMYSNQFVPLWQDASIWERLEADGKCNQYITGGGIVHAQVQEQLTSQQSKQIIRYAVDCGCEHFAVNTVYSICTKDHTHKGKLTVCPTCQSPIKDYMTRVIGMFTKVSAWNQVRREWEFDRRKFTKV